MKTSKILASKFKLLIDSRETLPKKYQHLLHIPYKFVHLPIGNYLIIGRDEDKNSIHVLDFIAQLIAYNNFENMCHNGSYDKQKLILSYSMFSNKQYIFAVNKYKNTYQDIEQAKITLNNLRFKVTTAENNFSCIEFLNKQVNAAIMAPKLLTITNRFVTFGMFNAFFIKKIHLMNSITLFPNWTLEKSILVAFKVDDINNLIKLLTKNKQHELTNLMNHDKKKIITQTDLEILCSHIKTT